MDILGEKQDGSRRKDVEILNETEKSLSLSARFEVDCVGLQGMNGLFQGQNSDKAGMSQEQEVRTKKPSGMKWQEGHCCYFSK